MKNKIIYTDAKSKTDVFISYKSDNVDFALDVVNELADHDISVWFDKDKLTQEVGEEYPGLISKGIDNAQIVLFIYTKEAETSDFIIQHELSYAKSKNKKICCYAQDKVDFETMNPKMKEIVHDIQWLADKNQAEHIVQYQESIEDEKYRLTLAATIRDFSTYSTVYKDINLFLIRIALQRQLGHPTPYGSYKTICKSESIYSEGGGIEMIVEPKAFYIPIPESKKKKLHKLKFFKEYNELKEKDREIADLIKTIAPNEKRIMSILKRYISRNYTYEDIYDWLSLNNQSVVLPQKECFGFAEFLRVVAEITADAFVMQIEAMNKTMFNGAMLGVYDIKDGRTQNVETHEASIKLYHSDYFTFKCMVEMYHILCSIENTFQPKKIKSNIKRYSPFLCSLGLGGFVIAQQDEYQTIMWTKRSESISSGNMWHFSYDETVNLLKDSIKIKGGHADEGRIKVMRDGTIKIDPYKNFYRALYEENGLKEDVLTENKGIIEIGIITSERLEVELLSFAVVKLSSGSSIPMQMRKFHNIAPDGYLEISKYEFRSINDSVNNYIGKLLTPESHYLSETLLQNKDLLSGYQGDKTIRIGKSVSIGKNVKIGKDTLIEDFSTISDNCTIGKRCKIHRNVFVDEGVKIGDLVKIQNNNSIYHGVVIEDGAFIGTNVSFTNDIWPRSINKDGTPVTAGDWELKETHVCKGASIGAGAVIKCGITIGEWAMIGCGAVVTHDVPAHAVVYGPYAEIHRMCEN